MKRNKKDINKGKRRAAATGDLWGKRPNKFKMPSRSPYTKKLTRRAERRQGHNIKDLT